MTSQEPDDSQADTDDRSAMAKGVDLSSRIISAGLGMGLLAWGGSWLDRRMGLKGPFLIAGALLGMGFFVWQLVKLVQVLNARNQRSSRQ